MLFESQQDKNLRKYLIESGLTGESLKYALKRGKNHFRNGYKAVVIPDLTSDKLDVTPLSSFDYDQLIRLKISLNSNRETIDPNHTLFFAKDTGVAYDLFGLSILDALGNS